MTGNSDANSILPIQFNQAMGSTVTGRHKDKTERIRESIDDLQLAINGCRIQLTPEAQTEQFSRSVAALARACSVFLRKLVLGDRNNAATRLLDDAVCTSMGLKFHKLVMVARDRKHEGISFSIDRGYMSVTKKDEETSLPEYTIHVPIGSQRLNITVQVPLPGMANWFDDSCSQEIGTIRVEELFDLESEPTFSCNDWLSQQLVLFDKEGIALKDIIRTIANTEGAHSVGGGRLTLRKGETPLKFNRRQVLEIVNNITLGNVKYNHIVVIETALYLYERIMQHRVDEGEVKGYYMPTIRVIADSPEDGSEAKPRLVGYQGGLILGLGGQEQVVSHSVRATKGPTA